MDVHDLAARLVGHVDELSAGEVPAVRHLSMGPLEDHLFVFFHQLHLVLAIDHLDDGD